ncbi:MAG: hypothetical protein JOZ45_11145 [Acidobacteriaceae bacterium]|nr:hypothetical protein [Acidobacteriaceae bacterium]MBV9938367.1 hypothetical protein [Acidobacteriaceae bacterium]
MKAQQFVKTAALAAVTLGVIILTGALGNSGRVQAHDDDDEASLVQRGFEIAPVPLNLEGKNRELVGLGSYFVNAVGDCNGCHTGGGPPNFNYAAGGNPYFGQKTKVDPTVYLSGGQDFGPVGTPTGASGYAGPHIISRNLTPDKTGRPEGGHTLQEFKQIMRHGTDFDHLHPTCTAAQLKQIEAGTQPFPNCIPTSPDNPADGNVLQVMPWPTFANMTDHHLDAIYEYLSAIPCIEGPEDPKDPLHNNCH